TLPGYLRNSSQLLGSFHRLVLGLLLLFRLRCLDFRNLFRLYRGNVFFRNLRSVFFWFNFFKWNLLLLGVLELLFLFFRVVLMLRRTSGVVLCRILYPGNRGTGTCWAGPSGVRGHWAASCQLEDKDDRHRD